MANVTIKCPQTGNSFPVGMNMDKRAFESAELSNNTIKCPECGGTHTWSKEDATLDEDE